MGSTVKVINSKGTRVRLSMSESSSCKLLLSQLGKTLHATVILG